MTSQVYCERSPPYEKGSGSALEPASVCLPVCVGLLLICCVCDATVISWNGMFSCMTWHYVMSLMSHDKRMPVPVL